MIGILATILLAVQPDTGSLLEILDFPVPEEAAVQQECTFWTPPDTETDDLADWRLECLEFPMHAAETVGQHYEALFEARGWRLVHAGGYAGTYQTDSASTCLSSFSIALATKDEPENEWDRRSADTGVLVFMFPVSLIGTCE